jgi:hypothetical protein
MLLEGCASKDRWCGGPPLASEALTFELKLIEIG